MEVYYGFPEHRKAGSVDIYLHSTNLQAQPIVLGRGTLGKSLSTFFSPLLPHECLLFNPIVSALAKNVSITEGDLPIVIAILRKQSH